MRRSLRLKMLLSYLVVVLVATVALVLAAELASGAFYADHVRQMIQTFGGEHTEMMRADLEQGFARALGQSLLVGLALAIPLALVLGVWVTRRVLEPIERLSSAAGRIAAGSYSERLPIMSQDELGRLVADFNRMAASLEGVEARRIELIGTVAHELRTPLAGLQGYAEGLSDGLFDREQAAQNIGREVSRLRRVVSDLTEVSRVEAGAVPLHLETFDVCLVLNELCQRYTPMVEDVGSSLELTCAQPSVLVKADRDRTVQILVNLIANALRHAPNSRIQMRVAAHEQIEISVCDNGDGIPPEHLPHIFERFYRADRARSREGSTSGGSGVGLTISRTLAVAMGGALRVSSRLGETCFTLVLPSAE